MLFYSDNQIRRYRVRCGLSQKQVSLLLGQTTQAHQSKWERGTKLPTLTNALKLSAALGCPVEILFSDRFDRLREEVHKRRTRYTISNDYDQ